METTITNTQKVLLTLTPMSDDERSAPVEGDAQFEVVTGSCTVRREGPLSAFIVSGDQPGDSEILVSADADLGMGVVTIMDTVIVHVTGAMATSLGLTLSAPEEK